MRVGSAVPMLHDVHVANVVQLHGDIRVLKEDVPPGGMAWLHHAQGSSCEHELIVAVLQIVAVHEFANIIDQSEIHTTEQQHVFPRCRVGTTFGKAAVDFYEVDSCLKWGMTFADGMRRASRLGESSYEDLRMAVNLRTCAVRAISVGRRSIELAP